MLSIRRHLSGEQLLCSPSSLTHATPPPAGTHMEMGRHRDPGTGQRRAVGMCPWWNCQVTGYCAHQLTHTNPKNFLALRPPPKRTLTLRRNRNSNLEISTSHTTPAGTGWFHPTLPEVVACKLVSYYTHTRLTPPALSLHSVSPQHRDSSQYSGFGKQCRYF